MSALSICSPHCGVSPETTSGGETYERELLTRLGRDGVRLELILARDKPHPAGVPNWTVHRFGIGRGLRWWVAPFVVPQAIERVHRDTDRDFIMTAQEAMDYGVIDEVITARETPQRDLAATA